MSEIQPSQETLEEILSYFNQDNFLKAEELANTLIKEYSNNIFLLKILGLKLIWNLDQGFLSNL